MHATFRAVIALVLVAPALAPVSSAASFSESFGSWPPAGWQNQDWANDGQFGCTLERNEDGKWASYSGWARAHSGNVQGAKQDSRFISPVVDVGSTGFKLKLDFDYDGDSGSGDIGQIIIVKMIGDFSTCAINNSCDSDSAELADSDSVIWCRNSNSYGFGRVINVPASVATGTVRIMFRYYNDKFYNYDTGYFRIDNVDVERTVVDNLPPVTTHEVRGEQCGGWYRPPVTVALSATDYPIPGASGVAATHHRTDGAAWQTYASPFAVAGDGAHSVQYYSRDNAGNVEATRSFSISVDGTAPVTTLAVGDPKAETDRLYVANSTLFSLSATDGAGSGVNLTEYRVNGGNWTSYAGPFTLSGPDGEYVIEYRSGDVACNLEETRSLTAFLDQTRPDVLIEAPVTPASAASGVVAAPDLSALRSLCEQLLAPSVCASLPLAEVPELSAPVDAGEHAAALAAQAAALDAACRSVLAAAVCDATTGALAGAIESLAGASTPAGAAVVSGTTTVRVNATDPVVNGGASGVRVVEFYLDGALMASDESAPYEWEWDTTQSTQGQHELRVVARDRVENWRDASMPVVVVAAAAAPVPPITPPEGLPTLPDLPGLPGLPALPPSVPALPLPS